MLGVLKRCGRTVNTNVKRQIFNSFIAPRLDYCLQVWGHLPKTSADFMDHSLLRALRHIVHDPKACFTGETCSLLGLRKFRHTTDVRCSVRIFNAIQRGTLVDIICLGDCAVSRSQTLTRSTGANKICSLIHTQTKVRRLLFPSSSTHVMEQAAQQHHECCQQKDTNKQD